MPAQRPCRLPLSKGGLRSVYTVARTCRLWVITSNASATDSLHTALLIPEDA